MSTKSNSNKLNGKDLVNVGIYSAIYFVVICAAAMLGCIPVLYPLLSVIMPVLGGIPVMLFYTKVKKPGMIFIMSVIMGIMMIFTGMGYYPLLIGVFSGIGAELIYKSGEYKSSFKAVLSYGVFCLWVLGNYVLFFPVIKITTEMLRKYLVEYQAINNCGKVTIDNIRRSLSTFFSWLEEEDYIIKSQMKRIHKVKTAIIVKDTIPDEKVEILRDNCNNLRDRAMIDFLLSTGIRVGELVRLNIDDIDFSERECVVYGKGHKERKAYFDAKTKIHFVGVAL